TRSGMNYSPWLVELGGTLEIAADLNPLDQEARQRVCDALMAPIPDEDDLPVATVHYKPCDASSTSTPPYDDVAILKTGMKRKLRDKARFKERRRASRLAEEKRAAVHDSVSRRIKIVSHKIARRVQAMPLSAVDISGAAVARTGFIGRRQPQNASDHRPLTKADAVRLGFQYIEWDGREGRPLLDNASRVFAVLAGSPKDVDGWAQVNHDAQQAFDAARSMYRLEPKQISHRRGSFPAVAAGISFGGGQKHVNNLVHSVHNQGIIGQLLNHPAVQRIAGFGDAAFKLYAPRLHGYYAKTMQTLLEDNATLKPNFRNSVFGCATFNLGPQVITSVHTDHLNLPAGWCAVTSIGDFDPKEGGHLLLWDLNLMIEFPPGSLILIPSAILRHSNTVVRSYERRYSFTQYSAGGLFRWVECGCKSQKEFSAEGGVHSISGTERWLRGIDMWSTWDELQAVWAE
ncbi:hypothetical protein TRAPUB_10992, partial [Trametes pubescens]